MMGSRNTKSATRPVAVAEQIRLGLSKYKYDPKFVSIPERSNGVLIFDRPTRKILKDVTLPTNVDIADLPVEVIRYFDKDGNPVILSFDVHPRTKHAYAASNNNPGEINDLQYHIDENLISVHNHPPYFFPGFSDLDIVNFVEEKNYIAEVRPHQKTVNNTIDFIVDNKKTILNTLNNLKKQKTYTTEYKFKFSKYGKWKNETKTYDISSREDKQHLNLAIDFVKKMQKNTDKKFIHYQLTNPENFNKKYQKIIKNEYKKLLKDEKLNDEIKTYKPQAQYNIRMFEAKNKAQELLADEMNKAKDSVLNFVIKDIQKGNKGYESAGRYIQSYAFNTIHARKNKYNFEIKYS